MAGQLGDPRENLDVLFQLAESLLANPLNQINRIGGHEVPAFDPQLGLGDVFRTAGYNESVSNALALGTDLVAPGPGELKALGELAPALASIPGFFRLLQRNPELAGEITEQGANLTRAGARINLQRLPDDTVEVTYLRRGDEPGTGSELKQIVREAAQQESVPLRATNAPFGPGNFQTNSLKNAERLIREGYVQLPDGSWILPVQGR